MLPGLECDAWGERNDCVIQEYEATARGVAGVGAVFGFLSDAPDRSAVLLFTGTASPAAVERAVVAAHPGPRLPLRVRAWASLAPSATAEDVWRWMEAEAKLPP